MANNYIGNYSKNDFNELQSNKFYESQNKSNESISHLSKTLNTLQKIDKLSKELKNKIREFNTQIEDYVKTEKKTEDKFLHKESFIDFNENFSVILEKHFIDLISDTKQNLISNYKNLEGTIEKLDIRKEKTKQLNDIKNQIEELNKKNQSELKFNNDIKIKLEKDRNQLNTELNNTKE